jgi:ferredoxin
MVKVTIDENLCIGCGACEATCPDLFEMKDDKAIVKTEQYDDEESAKEAYEACPVDAINLE